MSKSHFGTLIEEIPWPLLGSIMFEPMCATQVSELLSNESSYRH